MLWMKTKKITQEKKCERKQKKCKKKKKKREKKRKTEEYCLNKEICWRSSEALDFVGWTSFKSLSLLKRNAKRRKEKDRKIMPE